MSLKRYSIVLQIIFQILMISSLHAKDRTSKLELAFFGSSTCDECNTIKMELLKPLQEKNESSLKIHFFDINEKQSFQKLIEFEKKYTVSNPSPQELFFPDTVLTGFETIMAQAEPMIRQYLANPERWEPLRVGSEPVDTTAYTSDLAKRFENFSFLGITLAGLVDGINPCAIATMIFLISFLATQKRKKREILAIGLCFTFSVYCTYLLLGIGLFRTITALDNYHWISVAIRWGAVAFAGIFGVLAFVDAIAFSKTHKTQSIRVQLPEAVKKRIHRVITGNLKGSQLIIGAIVTGFLVTLLEAVCTGQMYLPTIILMTKVVGFKLMGWIYLAYYNLLFVLPLLIIMILAYYGLKWTDLAKATQKNMVVLKIVFGTVLIGLALFLGFAG